LIRFWKRRNEHTTEPTPAKARAEEDRIKQPRRGRPLKFNRAGSTHGRAPTYSIGAHEIKEIFMARQTRDEYRELLRQAQCAYHAAVDAEMRQQEEHWRRIARLQQRLQMDELRRQAIAAKVLRGGRDAEQDR
jgi:hypothetical protein